MEGTAKHGYQEQPKPDHLQTINLKGPIYINNEYKHHFNQIDQHLEVLKDLKAPIYDNEGKMKSHYEGIIEHVESLKNLKGPIYEFGEIGQKYEGSQILQPEATETKTLHGPKYNIDNDHHFSEIISQCNILKDLVGPVYEGGETHHSFSELKKNVESLKTLVHPIFMDERHKYGEVTHGDGIAKEIHAPIYMEGTAKHSYQEQTKPDHLNAKTLKGPIYINDDYKHHFSQIDQHLEVLKDLKAPIYAVECKSHYNGIIEHVESIKSLQGPIYEFGKPGHNFEGGQIMQPPATEMKMLHGPKYEIDNEHHFNNIISKMDKLKDLVGPVYDFGETAHQFSELKKHVESLRTLMGPIFVDERHR